MAIFVCAYRNFLNPTFFLDRVIQKIEMNKLHKCKTLENERLELVRKICENTNWKYQKQFGFALING